MIGLVNHPQIIMEKFDPKTLWKRETFNSLSVSHSATFPPEDYFPWQCGDKRLLSNIPLGHVTHSVHFIVICTSLHMPNKSTPPLASSRKWKRNTFDESSGETARETHLDLSSKSPVSLSVYVFIFNSLNGKSDRFAHPRNRNRLEDRKFMLKVSN